MFDHRRGLHRIVRVLLEGSNCRGCNDIGEPVVLHANSVLNLSNELPTQTGKPYNSSCRASNRSRWGRSIRFSNVDVGLDDDRVSLSFAVNLNRRLLGCVIHNCIPETYELL